MVLSMSFTSTPFWWCIYNTMMIIFTSFTFFFLMRSTPYRTLDIYISDWFCDRGIYKSFKSILCIKSSMRDINLPMMKKQALTSTPPDSTCSVILCWLFPGLLITLSWSVSGWVQKFASTRPLRNRKMEPYRAQREVSSFAVQMDST